jgi:dTDP-4-amino-4,6-dideoxygalactose transaminase
MQGIIALGQPTFGDEERAAVAAVLDSGWVAGQGPVAQSFEQRFAGLCGTAAALSLNNCTAALHLAVAALGAAAGDEVIVADYTFPATGHAVRYAGAEPVFADIRPDIWTVDPAAVEAAITPCTVGLIAVDAFGQPADYDELRAIAGRHDLWLLEDAACAAGASYRGKPASARSRPARGGPTRACHLAGISPASIVVIRRLVKRTLPKSCCRSAVPGIGDCAGGKQDSL